MLVFIILFLGFKLSNKSCEIFIFQIFQTVWRNLVLLEWFFFFFQRARFNICWILKLLNFIFLIRNEIINYHHISSKPIICIFRTTYGHMNDWMKVSRNGVPVTMSDNNWHNLKQVSLIRIIGDIRVPFTSPLKLIK